ncbi:hypothetical protein HDK64DRAFT_280924 [Phyllosticta capitalensis]
MFRVASALYLPCSAIPTPCCRPLNAVGAALSVTTKTMIERRSEWLMRWHGLVPVCLCCRSQLRTQQSVARGPCAGLMAACAVVQGVDEQTGTGEIAILTSVVDGR